MAIAFRSIASVASGVRTNTTVGAPAGAVNGTDIIVVGFGVGAATSVTSSGSSGFTQFATVNYNDSPTFTVNLYLYYRVHDGAANWTFTHASATTDGFALAYSGVDTSTPSDATAATNFRNQGGGGPATATANSITIATVGAFRIILRGSWDGNAITAPASWSERGDQPVSWVGDIAAGGTGATGTVSVAHGNGSNNSPWGTIHAALRPSAGAAPVPPILVMQPRGAF